MDVGIQRNKYGTILNLLQYAIPEISLHPSSDFSVEIWYMFFQQDILNLGYEYV